MKFKVISGIMKKVRPFVNDVQFDILNNLLNQSLDGFELVESKIIEDVDFDENNFNLLDLFLASKEIEGCSFKTINYYRATLTKLLNHVNCSVVEVTTDVLRKYLSDYKLKHNSSKTTIDNIRRILSSFFSWLEDEDYILKNPVRRIHKIKKGRVVKEVLSDEDLEVLRDNCSEIRDLAMVDLLSSTGIRVGELVNLNICDVDFNERECIVFGKGESERIVYFDARTKIHLQSYLDSRVDDNDALFVSLNCPYNRLTIGGVESRIRLLGSIAHIERIHPHKFRRTLATMAIDKGMPIEDVQKLLGHMQINTTMQYAMVNQANVKNAHRKFIS